MKKVGLLLIVFAIAFSLFTFSNKDLKKEEVKVMEDSFKRNIDVVESEVGSIEGELYDEKQIYFKDIEPLYRIFTFNEADSILEEIEKIFRKEKPNSLDYIFSEIEEFEDIVVLKLEIDKDLYQVTICKNKKTISYRKM